MAEDNKGKIPLKKCKICGKPFLARKRTKYCSKECGEEAKERRRKVYQKITNRILYKDKPLKKECLFCKRTFYQGNIPDSLWVRKKYCCSECSDKLKIKNKRVIIDKNDDKLKQDIINHPENYSKVCDYCKKTFYRRPEDDKIGWSIRKYCSKECRDKKSRMIAKNKKIESYDDKFCRYCNKKLFSYQKVYCSLECRRKYYQRLKMMDENYVNRMRNPKTCPNCKKVFYRRPEDNNIRWYQKKYCSDECRIEHWKKTIMIRDDDVRMRNPKTCPNCKKVFYRTEDDKIGWYHRKFCSYECNNKYFNNKRKERLASIDKFCLYCNKKLISHYRKFCDEDCRRKYYRRLEMKEEDYDEKMMNPKTCPNCKKVFYRRPEDKNVGWHHRKFCSKKCKNKYNNVRKKR